MGPRLRESDDLNIGTNSFTCKPPLAAASSLWHLTHMSSIIYKICPGTLWDNAEKSGEFTGAGIDLADGYIHFSTAEQTPETARLHFSGQRDLVIFAVDAALLGDALKWEASRGGQLFPHLYAPLSLTAVRWVNPLPLDGDGVPVVPALDAEPAA